MATVVAAMVAHLAGGTSSFIGGFAGGTGGFIGGGAGSVDDGGGGGGIWALVQSPEMIAPLIAKELTSPNCQHQLFQL